MSDSIHSSNFAKGPFRAHGDLEIVPGGLLVCLEAHGPFNVEGVRAMHAARLEVLARNPPTTPYVHLTRIHGNVVMAADVLEAYRQGLEQAYTRYMPPLAAAWVPQADVEGLRFMLPQYQAALAAVGTQLQVFDDVAQAEAWLKQILSGA